MIDFDVLSVLHEVASIDLKMALEKTLGRPRKCGRLRPPDFDLVAIKDKYIHHVMEKDFISLPLSERKSYIINIFGGMHWNKLPNWEPAHWDLHEYQYSWTGMVYLVTQEPRKSLSLMVHRLESVHAGIAFIETFKTWDVNGNAEGCFGYQMIWEDMSMLSQWTGFHWERKERGTAE